MKEKRYDIKTISTDEVLIKYGTFLWKNYPQNIHQKLVPDPFLVLVNNPKQLFHSRNSFRIRYFEKQKGPGTGD